jgi:peptidyl-prolyl cis-trans isomerase SurA
MVVDKLPGARVFDLGNFRLADLSAEMQSAIAQAQPGGVTQPLGSTAGVELIVRCDKPVPKIGRYHLPSRDQIEEQIYQEQMTTLARQYLRDLRRDADVEAGGKS